ncbi:MAG: hypothetical protein DMG07_21805 [Acidobacteria bacterium]|nr:MAG: hypothetical protein DMG07_21805 [Acidobacteriota bacterium]
MCPWPARCGVLAGPPPDEARAYRWKLPAPRRARLKEYRIGYVLDDPFCPVTPEVKEILAGVVAALGKEGAPLEEGWPEGVSPQATFDTYLPLLAAYIDLPEPALALLRQSEGKPWSAYAKLWMAGVNSSHREWLGRSEARLRARAAWQRYFRSHDAFLLPTAFVPAFPHDHAGTFFERVWIVEEEQRSDRPQDPCALRVAAARGHLRCWRPSTMHIDIACGPPPSIWPRGARNAALCTFTTDS